jgi:ABC-2 type transport system permease protein
LFNDVTRYWTVIEKNTLYVTWSPALANGVFLYNRLLWIASGLLALGLVWALFPMSVEALTARSQGRRAAKAKEQELAEALPVRSLVASRLPSVHQRFTPPRRLPNTFRSRAFACGIFSAT